MSEQKRRRKTALWFSSLLRERGVCADKNHVMTWVVKDLAVRWRYTLEPLPFGGGGRRSQISHWRFQRSGRNQGREGRKGPNCVSAELRRGVGFREEVADWKSAIRQIRNLRYEGEMLLLRSCGRRGAPSLPASRIRTATVDADAAYRCRVSQRPHGRLKDIMNSAETSFARGLQFHLRHLVCLAF